MLKKLLAIFLFCFMVVALLFCLYLSFLGLEFVFSKSFALGLLLVFFGLPMLGRLLFLVFFSIFSSIIALFLFAAPWNNNKRSRFDKSEEVVDVKYKVIK